MSIKELELQAKQQYEMMSNRLKCYNLYDIILFIKRFIQESRLKDSHFFKINGKKMGFISYCLSLSLYIMLKEICPRGNNKVVILYFLTHDKGLLFMLELY